MPQPNPLKNYMGQSHLGTRCSPLAYPPTSHYYWSPPQISGGDGYTNHDPRDRCFSRTGDGDCSCLHK